MIRKPPPTNRHKRPLAPLKTLCRKCRLIQRRRLPHSRLINSAQTHEAQDKQFMANALYAGVIRSWEALSERNRRTQAIDLAAVNKGDEVALGDLARLLMECADALFKQALTASHQRLGEHDGLPQG